MIKLTEGFFSRVFILYCMTHFVNMKITILLVFFFFFCWLSSGRFWASHPPAGSEAPGTFTHPMSLCFALWLFDIVKNVIKEPKTSTKKLKIETMDVRLNDEFSCCVYSRHFSKRLLFSWSHFSLRCQTALGQVWGRHPYNHNWSSLRAVS